MLTEKRFGFCGDCTRCDHDHQKLGADGKLVEGQKNITSAPLNAYEVLKRSEKLLEGFRFPKDGELTVGDLSWATAQKRKKDELYVGSDRSDGLTVGDLSFDTARRRKEGLKLLNEQV